ncbi:MAG: type II toxin-antitoxin system VapC family toxin [Dehalococcoidia bacterium]|nr:type II toxin-antitoxin system VapC family toxin [Dehalococcoidia bacterium]
MILYLDTSSLVKLYADEEGSEKVRELDRRASAATTSWITFAEARSTFARKRREREFTEDEYRIVVEEFEGDWGRYAALEVSPDLLRSAGDLAEKHGLRALDAIHLASALSIIRQQGPPIDLIFSSLDKRLVAAAEAEGIDCAPD